MLADSLVRGGPLGMLLGRFAVATGRIVELPPIEVIQELRGLVAALPLVGVPEQLLARGFVTQQLARIIVPLDRHPEILAALIELVASPWPGDEWFSAFVHLVDQLESVLRHENDLGPGYRPLDIRLAKALRYIKAHLTDPTLALPRVADQVGLSVSHLAHTMKERTGEGFVAHVRRQRVAAAKRLLEETVLSVKEIAAAVGYRTPRQFERDFKRLYGLVPKAVRQGPLATSQIRA